MYYRIEGSEYLEGKWSDWYGIGQVLACHETAKAFRGVSIPKCLRTGKYRNTRSWFTEYGWNKYRNQIMRQVESHSYWINTRIRVLTTENLPHIIMRGKTQAVENLNPAGP